MPVVSSLSSSLGTLVFIDSSNVQDGLMTGSAVGLSLRCTLPPGSVPSHHGNSPST